MLFGLAPDDSAVCTFSDNAVANQNRHPALLSFDDVPSLPNSPYRVAITGKRNRKRRSDLWERAEAPKTRSWGTDVAETPSGSESTHSSCAQHEDNSDRAEDHRHRGNYDKEL